MTTETPIRPLERFEEDAQRAEALKLKSIDAAGRPWIFSMWEDGIRRSVAAGDDEAVVYQFRRYSYIVSLTHDRNIRAEFREQFFFGLPVHLQKRARDEEALDRASDPVDPEPAETAWWRRLLRVVMPSRR